MLKQRIATALVLIAVLLFALRATSAVPFAMVTMLLMSAAAWEWSRINQCGSGLSLAAAGACALLCVAAWQAGWLQGHLRLLWVGSGAGWVLFSAWLLSQGASAWLALPRAVRWLGGLLALWVAWLAVMQARQKGMNFLFSVLVLVWAADIFAYFCGRTFGGKWFRNKLAPTVSPGKTWEGALGGLIGVLLCAVAWTQLEPTLALDSESLYLLLLARGWPVLLLGVVFIVAMSVVGDLVESLFKRAAGVKDSSRLLPGHGGVLDRIDALLPVLPLAMMLLEVVQP